MFTYDGDVFLDRERLRWQRGRIARARECKRGCGLVCQGGSWKNNSFRVVGTKAKTNKSDAGV